MRLKILSSFDFGVPSVHMLTHYQGIHSQGCDQSEVHCFKNPCSQQCQQVEGAAAVFDAFSSNAKSLL